MAIKILIGGSPCTHWSIAQKNNRETEPEGIGWELFKNYLIAKEKFKPDFFLYENNKSAAQPIKDQISRELGVDLMYINSALVSAQNRQRFYAFNWEVEQPEDRGILLKDILETGENLTSGDKSYCLTASYDGACPWNTIERSQRTMVAEPIAINTTDNKARTLMAGYYKCGTATLLTNKGFKGGTTAVAEPLAPFVEKKLSEAVEKYGYVPEMWNPYNNAEITDKSPTLTTGCGTTTNSSTVLVTEPVRVGDLPNAKGEISGSQATRIYSTEGKSVNLIANGGGQGAKTGLYAIPVNSSMNEKSHTNGIANFITNGGFDATAVAEKVGYARLGECDENGKPTKAVSCTDGKVYTVYEVKDGQITIKGKQYPIKLPDGYYIIRKLTVKECCRLQTMPDDYCKAVSNSQAYKGLGNGWTAEVIIHILNGALKDVPRDEEIIVLSLSMTESEQVVIVSTKWDLRMSSITPTRLTHILSRLLWITTPTSSNAVTLSLSEKTIGKHLKLVPNGWTSCLQTVR